MDMRQRGRDLLVGSGVIAVAMAAMNAALYAFTIIAARLLGPVEYGALAAVLGLLLVINVLSLGLQATGARRVAAAPELRTQIEKQVLRSTYWCAAGIGAVALLAAPLVAEALDLDSWSIAALIAVSSVPLTVMGGQAGTFQGERLWAPLALIYLASGFGRFLCGMGTMIVRPDALGAMVGVAVGAFAPVLVGWWVRRRRRPVESDSGTDSTVIRGVLRETVHNSHALLAFFALSNVDVVAARILLDDHQAGLYAGGLIMTKAVLFLPQFVVVIAFPSMSGAQSARRLNLLALGTVLAIGLVTVAGVALLRDLAVAFVGGPEYAGVADRLWIFAGLGTILAMLQMMVYNLLARQRQRAVFLIWAALVVVALASPLVGGAMALLLTVLTVDTLLLVGLLGLASRRAGTPAATVAAHG